MAHLFISYASNDARLAISIAQRLEQSGTPCWYAPRDIVAGQTFAAAIATAIEACRALVVVISMSSVQSRQVSRELDIADQKVKDIIPIIVDPVEVGGDIGYYIAGRHWLQWDQGLDSVVDAISNRMSPEKSDWPQGQAADIADKIERSVQHIRGCQNEYAEDIDQAAASLKKLSIFPALRSVDEVSMVTEINERLRRADLHMDKQIEAWLDFEHDISSQFIPDELRRALQHLVIQLGKERAIRLEWIDEQLEEFETVMEERTKHRPLFRDCYLRFAVFKGHCRFEELVMKRLEIRLQ